MKRNTEFTDDSKLVAVRLPKILKKAAHQSCREQDLTLSQLMRRALRRELGVSASSEQEEVCDEN
jgi:hypothetical protein